MDKSKKWNRALALVLALAMTSSLCSVSAYAEEDPATPTETQTVETMPVSTGSPSEEPTEETEQVENGSEETQSPETDIVNETDEETVAATEIGTEAELRAAAKKGGNYSLTADIALTDKNLIVYANFQLDLNGKTITAPVDTRAIDTKDGVTVQISNGTIATNAGSTKLPALVYARGENTSVTMSGVTFSNSSDTITSTAAVNAATANTTITLKDCVVDGAFNYVVNLGSYGGTATVSGTTVNQSVKSVVKNSSEGAAINVTNTTTIVTGDTSKNYTVAEGDTLKVEEGGTLTGNVTVNEGATFTLDGGAVNGQISSNGTVEINSGAVKISSNAVAIRINSGNFTMTGGSVTAENARAILLGTDNTTEMTATITGGTVSGSDRAILVRSAGASISGGTFSCTSGTTVISASSGLTYLAEGYMARVKDSESESGATWEIVPAAAQVLKTNSGGELVAVASYETLQDAINNLPGTSYTVKLFDNVNLEGTLNISKSLTLDGNGKTIVGDVTIGNAETYCAVTIKNVTIMGTVDTVATNKTGKVTINNSSIGVLGNKGGMNITLDEESTATAADGFAIVTKSNGTKTIKAGVVRYGTTVYGSIEDALTALKANEKTSATLEISNDLAENVTIPNGWNITLTIPEGVTLTNATTEDAAEEDELEEVELAAAAATDAAATITVESGAKLTIQGGGTVDGAVNNQGTLYVKGGTFNGSLTNDADCTLTVTDGTFAGTVENAGTATINGGTFAGTVKNAGTATINGGTFNGAVNNQGKLTVKGGSFVGTLTNAADCTLTVTDGTFAGTVENAGTATINGGTFAGTVKNAGTATIKSGVFNGDVTATAGTTKITAGTFTGTISKEEDATVTITGGTFSTAPDTAYIAKNYGVAKKNASTYFVGKNVTLSLGTTDDGVTYTVRANTADSTSAVIEAATTGKNGVNSTYTIVAGSGVYVTAKASDGYTVIGYASTADANEADLIKSSNYTFQMNADKAIYAVVKSSDTATVQSVVMLEMTDVSEVNGKYRVEFTTTRSITSGYTVVQQGIYYGTSEEKVKAGTASKFTGSTLTNNGAYVKTVTLGTTSTKTYYFMGYAIVQDSEGKQTTVCSDVITVSAEILKGKLEQ